MLSHRAPWWQESSSTVGGDLGRLRAKRRPDGALILDRSPPSRLAKVLWGLAVIIPPALAAISGAGLTGWMGACGLGAVVLALGLGFARALRIRYVVTERGVERSSPWSHRNVVMAWSDVTELASVQFLDESGSPTANWCFMLRGIASGQWTTFEIPEAMNGVGDFAREALLCLPPRVLATNPVAVESLERLRVGPT